MNGNAVGTRQLCKYGRCHRVRLWSLTCLSNCSYMVDIDSKFSHAHKLQQSIDNAQLTASTIDLCGFVSVVKDQTTKHTGGAENDQSEVALL